jgi:hypothetical protein
MFLRPLLLTLPFAAVSVFAADPPEPKFRAVTIDDKIQIGYGVAVADVDGDGKPDVLLADKKQFVWYRNPTWEKFLIAENLTEKDNVCLAAQDLDGDGKCEIAVGAEWNPGDTEKSGAVFYLIPPADRTQKWEPVKFPSVEPTTHRMKWLKLDGDKWGLVVVPLHGRGNKNGEGVPVKVLCYVKPADPRAEWKAEVVDESMHATHNFDIPSGPTFSHLYLGGREGFKSLQRKGGAWTGSGNLATEPGAEGFQGAGEIRFSVTGAGQVTATVEPMHGNALVAYLSMIPDGYKRTVLTEELADGHALACGDLLGTGRSQVVVGWRGNPQKPRPVGIKMFSPLDLVKGQWRESLIDDNEMACEDLVLADLNADGKLDIVASGRATKNVKIYFNER